MRRMIDYDAIDSEYRACVMVNRIVRLSKEMMSDGRTNDEITLIHLDNGEILRTKTSINTLEARINSKD